MDFLLENQTPVLKWPRFLACPWLNYFRVSFLMASLPTSKFELNVKNVMFNSDSGVRTSVVQVGFLIHGSSKDLTKLNLCNVHHKACSPYRLTSKDLCANCYILSFMLFYRPFCLVALHLIPPCSYQDGGCGGSEVREEEVDPLLWECHLHHVPGGAQRVWPGPGGVWQRGETETQK